MTSPSGGGQFDVGGVMLPRPFKIRRLGHFGYNCHDIEAMLAFYVDLVGLQLSDQSNRLASRQTHEVQGRLTEQGTYLHFTRYGTEHHQFVLIAQTLWDAISPDAVGRSINQVTWQVGSMQEVVDADRWIRTTGGDVIRAGRDMPGSNWHTYLHDHDGHVHELYYGMEQIGWDGLSKPPALWDRGGAHDPPELPIDAESTEISQAERDGVDLFGGWRRRDDQAPAYPVDGVVLPRPFKVVGLGPVSLYTRDLDAAAAFLCDVLGFEIRDRVEWRGRRGALLGFGTARYQLALYDGALRTDFGHDDGRSSLALGIRLANYRQLRDAHRYLRDHGATEVDVPAELLRGFDYVSHLRDPDGNLVQLYYHTSPVFAADADRTPVSGRVDDWPDVVQAPDYVYDAEPFLGPWN